MEEHNPADENVYPSDWRRPRKSRSRIDSAGYTLSAQDKDQYVHSVCEKYIVLVDRPKSYSNADEAKFKRLAEVWQRDTAIYSSMVQTAMHPAYQNIIGMGKDALPFLFKRLQSEGDEPHHWFWALAAITGENPVPKESRGRVAEMAKAWFEWGRENGYGDMG
jgi:hypothetical protein